MLSERIIFSQALLLVTYAFLSRMQRVTKSYCQRKRCVASDKWNMVLGRNLFLVIQTRHWITRKSRHAHWKLVVDPLYMSVLVTRLVHLHKCRKYDGLETKQGDPPECWTRMAQQEALQVGYCKRTGEPAVLCPMITNMTTSRVDAHSV